MSQTQNTPDKKLWELLRSDNKLAFSSLYKRHVKGLFNFGLRHTQNKSLLKDVVQELFTDLWQKRHHLNKVEHVKVYLIKSYRNKLLRALDKEYKARTYSLDEIMTPQVDNEALEHKIKLERRTKLKRQLDKLPKRQREVIYLRYFQNLKNDEIAEVININYQSVSNLLFRALSNLRKNMETLNSSKVQTK